MKKAVFLVLADTDIREGSKELTLAGYLQGKDDHLKGPKEKITEGKLHLALELLPIRSGKQNRS